MAYIRPLAVLAICGVVLAGCQEQTSAETEAAPPPAPQTDLGATTGAMGDAVAGAATNTMGAATNTMGAATNTLGAAAENMANDKP